MRFWRSRAEPLLSHCLCFLGIQGRSKPPWPRGRCRKILQPHLLTGYVTGGLKLFAPNGISISNHSNKTVTKHIPDISDLTPILTSICFLSFTLPGRLTGEETDLGRGRSKHVHSSSCLLIFIAAKVLWFVFKSY